MTIYEQGYKTTIPVYASLWRLIRMGHNRVALAVTKLAIAFTVEAWTSSVSAPPRRRGLFPLCATRCPFAENRSVRAVYRPIHMFKFIVLLFESPVLGECCDINNILKVISQPAKNYNHSVHLRRARLPNGACRFGLPN